ncbi:SHOCT domain-containing protein [Haloterrigena salifodinae]|uniref:SHOCT domain-containing protein n=1 Tax=Haloterrigena salifodinae TaxID=2675099 RepID=A0A8T8DZH5_9EURY|nr:SHOCT domain-containing protein [Haloterrigena salifodinae]
MITIVGWFVLTPILLFWGDEVALLLEDDGPTDATRTGEPAADSDPLEELKRRYAAGEIDDSEFERRLERLVAVDELPDDAIGASAPTETTADEPMADAAPVSEAADEATEPDSLERDRDRERARDR